MKDLIVKLCAVPFAAYFSMMLTVALLGSTIGNQALNKLIGGTGLYIWMGWMGLFSVVIFAYEIYKRYKNDKELEH
jgi:hypothetical protein